MLLAEVVPFPKAVGAHVMLHAAPALEMREGYFCAALAALAHLQLLLLRGGGVLEGGN